MLKLPKQFSPDFSRKGVKPTGPVEIDWSNPLTKGLWSCITFTEGLTNLVPGSGKPTTVNSYDVRKRNHFGESLIFRQLGGDRVALNNGTLGTKNVTVIGRQSYDSVGIDQGLFNVQLGGNARLLLWGDTLSSQLRPATFAGVPNYGADGSLSTLADPNKYVTWGSQISGSTAQNWTEGGKSGALATIGVLDFSIHSDISIGGDFTGTNKHLKGLMSFNMVWTRTLSDAEMMSILADPYQILKPATPQIYFTPSSAPSGITGTLNSTLTDITSVASGTVSPAAITGTLASTLEDTSMVASGQVFIPITGTIASTLDDVTSVASGFLSIIGTSTVTLEDVISNSSGIVAGATAGTINVTLEDATSVSSGILTTIGTINTALDDAVMVASGIVHVPITGTVSVTLADTVMVASGVVIIIGNVGTVNSILDDAVMTASGNVFVPITGTVSVTLEDVIVSSIGIVEVPIVPGSLVGTIGTSGTGNFTWWAVTTPVLPVYTGWDSTSADEVQVINEYTAYIPNTGTVGNGIAAVKSRDSGKWYFEYTINLEGDSVRAIGLLGLASVDADLDMSDARFDSEWLGIMCSTTWTQCYANGVGYGDLSKVDPLDGVVLSFAVDLDNHTVGVYISGDLYWTLTNVVQKSLYPAVSFDQDPRSIFANFGQVPFVYPAPPGFETGWSSE